MPVEPLPTLRCPVCDDRMASEEDEFAIMDLRSHLDNERLCSEECRKEYDAAAEAAEEGIPRKHHDECDCYTCHARWRKELNK